MFVWGGIATEQHQKAEDILRGKIYDPTFDPVIYSAGEEDDWQDPTVWQRVNPPYGVMVSPDSFRAEFDRRAAGGKGLNFGQADHFCGIAVTSQWT